MPDLVDGTHQLAQTLPAARYLLIEAMGQLAPLETPAAFEAPLREFFGVARS